MMIRVLSQGFASFQDIGRMGFRSKGIPYAGVMDVDAFNLCNQILNNVYNTPLIEYCKSGLKIQATSEFFCTIIGQVKNIKHNNKEVQSGRILRLKIGDILDTGKVEGGTFANLGIAGNYRGKSVMDSFSDSPHISKTDVEEIQFDVMDAKEIVSNNSRIAPILRPEKPAQLMCIPGPEWDFLNTEIKDKLKTTSFHLSRETWRMAFKVKEKLQATMPSISSAPVLPGTVQLTPSGEIIILMRDAQTTGGYPRILHLSDDSINKLSRVGWGGEIKFHV
jgi:allophanate hydrolase subunit 2